jgi:tRNA A-37 threonylcarbamoyl transferase component Bud32
MTLAWPLAIGDAPASFFELALADVLAKFAVGAASPDEHVDLARLVAMLEDRAPVHRIDALLRVLSRDGYLRGALAAIAGALSTRAQVTSARPGGSFDDFPSLEAGADEPGSSFTADALWRAELALLVARELLDALDRGLGIGLARAVLTLPEVEAGRWQRASLWSRANALLAESLEEAGDAIAARRHWDAVLAVDLDDVRAMNGWARCTRRLELTGALDPVLGRGLALLDGVEELELDAGLGTDRYVLERPLGRGRHAVVYEALDRRLGRKVAIKRLLGGSARSDGIPDRVLEARFFAEAKTLANVRSAHVVALYDVRPQQRYVVLELCRGGTLRHAMRRRVVGPEHLDIVSAQLRAALHAVHTAGAVHRDVKPANVLLRESDPAAGIVLADFGLAIPTRDTDERPQAGTLRYLAPELRAGEPATPASDRFAAGVILLELATTPRPLPPELDRPAGDFDAASLVPDSAPPAWAALIRRLLSRNPEARTW